MLNIFKKNKQISDLLKNSNLATKIEIYFSTKAVGDYYDSYEKNYTYTNLNPITIKGYVKELKPEALVWKQYGLSEVGAKEILCEDKYEEYFRLANKIKIDTDTYQTYRENVGNRCLITKLPCKLMKVVVSKLK